MQERATGLILRVHPLTETSLIIRWLSVEAGRVATVAKGARRPKSAFRGKLDLYFLADVSFVRSRRSELHHLCEVVLRETHPQLRRDLGWLRQAAYAASLIEQLTETDTPLPETFALLLGFLQQLPREPATPRSVFAFELKLLAELGWQPDWQREELSAGTKALLEKLPRLDWPEIACFHFSPAQESEAGYFLKHFIGQHCERVPKKREAAITAG
jgi:DNA repair protein RecO (recombination protein O)